MNNKYDDVPLSETSIPLGLAEIQRRCTIIIENPAELSALSLEEPPVVADHNNPYNRG